MDQFLAYLLPEDQQGVEDMRIKHLLSTLDVKEVELRYYIQGLDFRKNELEHNVPFVMMNGKKKSFDNLWKEVIGERELDTDI
jgi:hypothetical protein